MIGGPLPGSACGPELVTAAAESDSLATIAGALCPLDRFEEELVRATRSVGRQVAVNLIVAHRPASVAQERASHRYLTAIAPVLAELGCPTDVPLFRLDDEIDAKLSLLERTRPGLVTFTFGAPAPEHVRRLMRCGITVATTVSSVLEARAAIDAGTEVLVVQGADAGGPQVGFDPFDPPRGAATRGLVTAVRAITDLPIIAAGGVGTATDARHLRGAGAELVQVATALIAADESRASPAYRRALLQRRAEPTVVTRTFSGRWERGLSNAFTREFESVSALGFPLIAHALVPLAETGARLGDPDLMPLWAGTGLPGITEGAAGSILRGLAAELF